ncbi:MAG: hypothetical protein ACXADD_16000 [Candidatus Thorarchaeota archaeon]|jgi:phosphomannomutase
MGLNGIEVSKEVEAKIENVYFEKQFKVAEWNAIGKFFEFDDAIREFIEAIKIHVDVEAIKGSNLTVVVDGANSVGSLSS